MAYTLLSNARIKADIPHSPQPPKPKLSLYSKNSDNKGDKIAITMTLQIKASLLLVLLLISSSSGAVTEGFKEGMNIPKSLIKDGIAVNSRKLLGHDLTDYDDAGPNHKNEPCKKGKLNCPKNP